LVEKEGRKLAVHKGKEEFGGFIQKKGPTIRVLSGNSGGARLSNLEKKSLVNVWRK